VSLSRAEVLKVYGMGWGETANLRDAHYYVRNRKGFKVASLCGFATMPYWYLRDAEHLPKCEDCEKVVAETQVEP